MAKREAFLEFVQQKLDHDMLLQLKWEVSHKLFTLRKRDLKTWLMKQRRLSKDGNGPL